MKRFWIFIAALHVFMGLSGQVQPDQTMIQLATQYFNARDFERAAPLFKEIYDNSRNRHYFRQYLVSLTELQRFDEAISEIKEEIRKSKSPQPDLLVHWGYILRMLQQNEESDRKYEEAISITPPNTSSFILTGNAFQQWREFNWAERLYQTGRQMVPNEMFHMQLATIYRLQRNYPQMLEELLEIIKNDDRQLSWVQSNLSSALYMDIDSGFKDEFRTSVLRRIQSEPNVLAYNRLLIWYFLQERQFPSALRQLIALDRRTGDEDQQIMALAQMAINNQQFQDAASAYDYILSKGNQHPSWHTAFMNKLHSEYRYHLLFEAGNKDAGNKLAEKFQDAFETLGYHQGTVSMIRDFAHLLAFYLEKPDSAIVVLERGLAITGLRPLEAGHIKTDLADVYVYADDPFEAILLYSQVIDANRNNSLGDEVQLKKARLSYFMEEFAWAKAQLDVLKASTSKLTANDAMELSLFIAANSGQDSTDRALQYFSRADLLFFRNKNKEAMATLDSIYTLFPYHSIIDNVLFRQAKIHLAENEPETAATLLERISNEYRYGLLADDALYLLADTYLYRLIKEEKAAEAYRRILFEHPGSIYVPEAREKFRSLNTGAPQIERNEETEQDILDYI